jgi:hypothetical protein
MALDKDRLGNAIADRILTFAGYALAGADDARLRELCKAIADEVIKEVKNHADLDLEAGDIPVDPGTFVENNPVPATPITGVGTSQAVILPMRIK